ncbi:RDD family protein [Lacisediminihabitans sp. G11-30]|uniref:RDD family protein n=2 Tax=Lacisediminihabitans changchengi TaxID=2787634 RepID=A0A934SGT8_9MICO|nr:RDD family protein [Lacisediminihabitans changchengi]
MTGEAVALDVRPTGFVLRGAGAAIDFLVSGVTLVLVLLAINSPPISRLLDKGTGPAATVTALVFCLVVLPTVIELASRGKSLGRLAVGARIVRDDGGAIGFRHAFVRALTGALELFFTLGGLAAVVALLAPRSKRLGDLLAGTYSQNERVPRLVEHSALMPAELATWAATADVGRMPEGLARRVSQFLGQAPRLVPAARLRLGIELSAEVSRYVSTVPGASPESFLTAVTVVRRDREAAALRLERERLDRVRPVLDALPHGFPERD